MTAFFALLTFLALSHYFPWRGRTALHEELAIAAGSLRRRLDANDTASGRIALGLWLAIIIAPLMAVYWIWLGPSTLLSFAAEVGLLYVLVQFWPISNALQDATLLAAKRASPAPDVDASVARRALAQLHHEALAPLFWYALLPGPLGLLLFVAARSAALYWRAAGDFGEPAAQVFRLLDWLPQRFSALIFAVMGNFEDALYAWRAERARARLEAADEPPALVIAAAAGALGRHIVIDDAGAPTPQVPMSAEGLQAVTALAWRSVGVVLVLLVLIGVGRVL